MKSKIYLLAGVFALGLFATSCSNDNNDEPATTDGILKINLVGSSTDGGLRAAANTLPDESKINKFTVYVFNALTEALETSVPGNVGGTTTISGLSTGFAKKIVVVANQPTTFPIYYEGDTYSEFMNANAAINLDYQSPTNVATNGLVMMGESPSITLSGTGTNEVTVELKRLAAKVSLGAMTIVPAGDYDPDLFEVTGVSVQRAVGKSDIFGNQVGTELYCGVLGSFNSTVKSYLNDAISPVFEVGVIEPIGNYFYVFPNDNPESCTLLTVAATYDGEEMFFPVKINSTTGSGNMDGTYIQSNKSYILNLTVNNLGEGTTDPDVPPTEANLDVNIEVLDWEMTITQNEVW